MIISYDFGHMEGGNDTSAKGIVYEYAEIRKYGLVTINELIRQGHTLINCTPANGPMTLQDSLSYRVNKANTSGSQLHLCFHVNAFDGKANGSECEVASDNGAKYAQSILNEIYKLGFTRRGVNRPSLFVTKNTNMTAVLIEPFFCDSKVDIALYNPTTLGLAIAKGVINIIGNTSQKIDTVTVPTGDNITLLNGGGWIERALDGRTIVHQSKTVYLALTADGHLDFYSNGSFKRIV